MDYSIAFPHLHIYFDHVGKSVEIFGIEIAYYGIIIAVVLVAALIFLSYEAKRLQEDVGLYLDYAMFVVVFGFVAARIYYVACSWDLYKNDLLSIFNFRAGGIGVYGGLIGAFITALIFTRVKKMSFFKSADIAVLCMLIAQIFGRWGNFFNREAFGEYTDSLFAMRLPLDAVRYSDVTEQMWAHSAGGYIQVTPTFLYESLWNLGLLVVLLLYRKHKKYNGQLMLLYFLGYGIGRFWIESLRTDQLLIPFIGLPISMVVAALTAAVSLTVLIILRVKKKKNLDTGTVVC